MEVHERRRILLATAFTLVALPSIWLFDRNDPAASPSVAVAGLPSPSAGVASSEPPTLQPETPVFLDNTLFVPPPLIIDAATPEPTKATVITGRGTHLQYAGTVDQCTAPGVPGGAMLTVTNIDSGLSITCKNTLGTVVPNGLTITIDTDLFVQIANLVDSPVPVRIDW